MKTKLEERFIWLGGKIVPVNDAKINVLAPTSQFGANVFEGIRCYWNDIEKQLYAFRLQEHFKRLCNSIKIFRMENKYSEQDFKEAFLAVIKANNYMEDIAVRQTVFIDGFSSWSATGPVNMFVAPIPKMRIQINENTGFKCGISSWQRISDKSMSPKAKVGANYINGRMAQLEALEHGYDSAILMNDNGKIAEAPGSSLFMVKDNTLITPPLSASILDSITRKTLIDLAKNDLNLNVMERDIERTDLFIADEIFLCGSAMEIMPVLSIDGYQVGSGKAGSITIKIHDFYIDTVTGNIAKYKHWLTAIY